ncbi:putative toxin-antitoxin system toxin component, PIN family [Candidatus Collierbacteria bacterium]|nr:putative toxin-antitoxin system toxin component, PIN family [Candidatus Collierbacteria bacterium]
MVRKVSRVVLDTNVLISGIVFGGKPREILEMVKNKKLLGITSPVLLAELGEVLSKKIMYSKSKVMQVEKKMRKIFRVVRPIKSINAVADDDDNRVLEAAIEGKCDYVVTGDRDLLDLKSYMGIRILTPAEFLEKLSA